jgi:hypothetical protein
MVYGFSLNAFSTARNSSSAFSADSILDLLVIDPSGELDKLVLRDRTGGEGVWSGEGMTFSVEWDAICSCEFGEGGIGGA